MKRLLFVVLVLAFVLPGCRGAAPFIIGAGLGSLFTYEATRPRPAVMVTPAQATPPCPPDTPPEECLNANAGVPPSGYEAYPGYPGYYYYPYSPYPLFWYGGYYYGYWGGYWHGRYGSRGSWGYRSFPGHSYGFHRGYAPRGGGGHGGGHNGGGHGGGHSGGGHGGHR